MQQPQQLQQAHVQLPHQARQLEAEVGSEDSPSTADSRLSRGSQNVYGQNFAMPLHPSNFALVAPLHHWVVPVAQVLIMVKRSSSSHSSMA